MLTESHGKAAIGGLPEDAASLYLKPTVLTGLPNDGRVARE